LTNANRVCVMVISFLVTDTSPKAITRAQRPFWDADTLVLFHPDYDRRLRPCT